MRAVKEKEGYLALQPVFQYRGIVCLAATEIETE